jgi:hypothetical protein
VGLDGDCAPGSGPSCARCRIPAESPQFSFLPSLRSLLDCKYLLFTGALSAEN